MSDLPSGKRRKKLIGLWFEPSTEEKFRALCKAEHRDLSQQMELILEEWFAARESACMSDVKKLHVAEGKNSYGKGKND